MRSLYTFVLFWRWFFCKFICFSTFLFLLNIIFHISIYFTFTSMFGHSLIIIKNLFFLSFNPGLVCFRQLLWFHWSWRHILFFTILLCQALILFIFLRISNFFQSFLINFFIIIFFIIIIQNCLRLFNTFLMLRLSLMSVMMMVLNFLWSLVMVMMELFIFQLNQLIHFFQILLIFSFCLL